MDNTKNDSYLCYFEQFSFPKMRRNYQMSINKKESKFRGMQYMDFEIESYTIMEMLI